MAKARSAPSQQSVGDNYEWTCMYPDCGVTQDGFSDMDSAAASTSDHFASTHSDSLHSPSFSYENLNVAPSPPDPVPVDLQGLWDAVPNGNITKTSLAAFMKAAFNLK